MNNPETHGMAPLIQPAAPSPSAPTQVEIDDSQATAQYSNFCRLSAAPEELLMDFALNPLPVGPPTHPVAVTQRVVTGWHTAKRLMQVLQLSVQRHETMFGVLELDVQQRVRNQRE
jgi:hypothetical protein